jgi:hypothetical protein
MGARLLPVSLEGHIASYRIFFRLGSLGWPLRLLYPDLSLAVKSIIDYQLDEGFFIKKLKLFPQKSDSRGRQAELE